MPNELNFYELLQVDRRATIDVIEAAYHRLAKKYHPDLNKSPDAAETMQKLNYAYQILSDPQKRAEYDRWIFGEDYESPSGATKTQEEPQPTPQPVRCENCGRVDETLRATVFQYVISIVILSFKRGGGAGIFCSECRRGKALTYTLLSILLGPWGIPWGIFWTLEAIAINLSGGRQPAEINGPLLYAQGAYLWSASAHSEAISAFDASLHFQDDPKLRAIVEELRASMPAQRRGTTSVRTAPQTSSNNRLVALGLFGILVLVCGGLALVMSTIPSPSTSTLAPSGLPPISNAANNAPLTPVSDLAFVNRPSPTENPMSRVTPIAKQTMWICNATSVDIRAGPGPNYRVVDRIDASSGNWWIAVFGRAEDWYYAGYDEQKTDQFVHQSNLCDVQPAPSISRILEGPMKNGLKTGDMEWNALGYSLVDYARQIEVQMLFHNRNPSTSKNIALDFRLVVDGQEFRPSSLRTADIDLNSKTYSSEKQANLGMQLALGSDEYVVVLATFDIPTICASADQQKDACMKQRMTEMKWLQYNLRDTIWMFQ